MPASTPVARDIAVLRRIQHAANMLSYTAFLAALGWERNDYSLYKWKDFQQIGVLSRFDDGVLTTLMDFHGRLDPPATESPRRVSVTMVWDFGGSETEELLDRDRLWDLIMQGRADKEGKVTSLVIWVNDPAHPATVDCPDQECTACGQRDCPHHEPLHYHHDGCPACFLDENTAPEYRGGTL